MITSKELREKYLQFFKDRGHAIIGSASIIPDNDPTVLFTTAGMHPLVPYLLGAPHPQGKRLADVQKCVRTGDIDDVGDATHCTFFEMLGNWSLGDYFKKESITWSFQFLTEVLKINPANLAVSVFAGDADAPRDEVSADIWAALGIPRSRIFYLPKENNWWGPAGITGPCGPDTEIFIVRDVPDCSPECSPACSCGKYVEIWNNVFMEYNKQADGSFIPLAQKNVDTGMGLERTVAMLNGYGTVYETDVFAPIIQLLKSKTTADIPGDEAIRAIRIIADHIRTATFILGDDKGLSPSNVDQGYILRRLIRRSLRFARKLELDPLILTQVSQLYVDIYKDIYEELGRNNERIIEELKLEIEKFSRTLQQGLKEFEKLCQYIQNNSISGKAAFRLYDTFGFPIEMTVELARDNGITVDVEGYEACYKEHQLKSQAGAEQKFKGGLADNTEETAKLHTATHILLASLKKVLGDEGIQQKGSNITAERLRFDFNFPRPLTAEEIKAVEDAVNAVIKAGYEVTCREMPLDEAKRSGATGVFDSRYDQVVKVYSIGDYSKEICGGPHAKNTADLGSFEIVKEQSSSSGIRRIKAILK
ncbi:MAG TPA: alanine--tRNA ligase [Clostridia bacterium]|jgi:alanyl-tRNA synthetase|nr:alanine--tRNA ligase [Clostridia bacterium]HOK81855.1 alanine--tRNA ligase [Clostridia bacterium]HOL60912.1 alanine--tRNA ligase [Clostridia bacterium]HPO53582.1 alanine--tRNA ligase [Clostridia bacterium]